jgi:hypothetical protein
MNKLDRIVEGIRAQEPTDSQIEAAAARVRQKFFTEPAGAPDRLRSCSDFQAIVPAYLNKTLSAARSLLLQDHTRECVACRHALERAREGSVPTLVRPVTAPSHSISKVWAIAAMLVVSLGLGTWAVMQFLPGGNTAVAVQNVNGILYAISGTGTTAVFSGRQLAEGERVRTAKSSTAVLRLADGSLVEMNERSELAVTHAGHGATIRLDRGDIIVQAAKQRSGTLDVLTPECLVSVKGTVFAVNRGIKGSRVSVVEGSVKVSQGSQTQMLKPGEQVSTDTSIAKVPVRDAVAWSRESAKYLALLGEFSNIQKRLEAIPSPGLRYDSKLLSYVPRDAVLYAAIPNLGSTLDAANQAFQERLRESEVLREWWNEQKDGPKIDELIAKVRTLSSFLGDEIVLTIGSNDRGEYTTPLMLAEVKQPGLQSFLQNELRQMGTAGQKNLPQIVELKVAEQKASYYRRSQSADDPASAPGPVTIALNDKLIAIGWDRAQLDEVATRSSEAPHPLGQHSLLAAAKQSYDAGAGWLFSVDMERIARDSVNRNRKHGRNMDLPPGLENMRYLIVERKDSAGKTENMATLNFAGRRAGMAAWLAEPAPMGTLDFVSPSASFAVSMVLRQPQWMLGDVFQYARKQNPKFDEEMDRLSRELGVQPVRDLAQPLGGEFTFAIDGPLLPLPSWKLAVEVYDAPRLQWAIEQLVQKFNSDSKCQDCNLQLAKEDVSGRTYYTITSSLVSYEIHYVFVDGYFVAAPNRTLLTRAIQNRETGNVLVRSEAFRSQLPRNGIPNFSAILYHNLGSAVAPMARQLGSANALTPSQRAGIDALSANAAPGMIYAYGNSDQIVVASQGSFFGLNLNTLALPQLMGQALPGGHGRDAKSSPRSSQMYARKTLKAIQ